MSSGDAEQSGQGGEETSEPIPLSSLSLNQLFQLKQSVESEIQTLNQNIQALKLAQNKFRNSAEALVSMASGQPDNEILIPLSSSLYVKGQVADVTEVMVDIGTGYHVKMSIEEGKKHLQGKVDFLKDQIGELTKVLTDKRKLHDVATVRLQSLAYQQKMAGGGGQGEQGAPGGGVTNGVSRATTAD
uniref:Prefoldin subunit 5 n=1 Tax=Chromera velia CCMP2878 TaxID=1169474 RepID=A0A0G4FQQ8_9ALVE|eukprot:Cvel_18263.t1-p1 / transcript=Cvel_18263.t1 / gene=Cvel_18263 / organism=Chromera_velia_CCMP2878 / gene_product=Probable prefoldin subunit 5, putative / transcript_product=Probable prefoldin subunit 5, putative / location=Cvel_scaffold1503:27091-29440(-) / protein_length=186 / sequence_SO=supercontig / SO=protein_coding / is_pseudo=false